MKSTAAAATTTLTNVDAVMIYNPLLDREPTEQDGKLVFKNVLYTGSLNGSGMIPYTSGDVSMSSTLPGRRLPLPLSAEDIGKSPLRGARYAGEPEESVLAAYNVGSTHSFWIQRDLDDDNSYAKATLTCRAVGTYCYIWGNNTFNNTAFAQKMVSEFDTKIYNRLVSLFGSARFMESGEKLNILCYDMSWFGWSDSLCGYFYSPELLTASEIRSAGASASIYNAATPIIHVNSFFCNDTYAGTMFATLAHEFQHLINYTSALKNSANTNLFLTDLWLDESMSVLASEFVYPGVDSAYYVSHYNNSALIRGGQSLYNFEVNDTDIAVYPQAMFFAEYLRAQSGGNQVFTGIHATYRQAPVSNILDANALRAALPSSVVNATLNSVNYPLEITAAIGIASPNDVFLSKLNLNFQISIIQRAASGIYSRGSSFAGATPPRYTGSSGTWIQGGGRIYLQVNGSFTVPAGADPKLIYIGFKNGKMSVAPTTAANYTGPIVTPTPSPEPTPFPTLNPDGIYEYGDPNCDGKVTAADAALILRYIVKLDQMGGQCLANADANGDGKITAADAAQILRYIVKLESTLGPR